MFPTLIIVLIGKLSSLFFLGYFLTFIFIWSEFLFALILNNSEIYTVPVRLSMYFSEAVGLKWGPQSALATISIIPMILMAFIGQNYIVRALTFGAVK